MRRKHAIKGGICASTSACSGVAHGACSSGWRQVLCGRSWWGGLCFNPLGWSGGVTKGIEEGVDGEEVDGGRGGGVSVTAMRLDLEMDGMAFDDPEDDGRGLVNAAWGTGSAIEIVGPEC